MATASVTSSPAPSKLYNLDMTIVNAKHLKNVNRRPGDHRPYVIFWVDPDRRLATKPDDSGTTRPVWNERFVLPLSLLPRDSLLTLEIFHSRPETSKPLVGTLIIELRDLLIDSNESAIRVKSFEVKRPSGRPHAICTLLHILLLYRLTPDVTTEDTPAPYSSLPVVHQPPAMSSPPPPPAPQSFSYTYSDLYSGYYPGYYSQVPSLPSPRPFFDRQSSYGGPGPSAPVAYAPYDHQKRGSGKFGMGGMSMGLAVGAVARTLWRAGTGRRDKVRGREDSR
ncbi:C2 domain-containing protein [Abeliophyllum distichum]|uniref:C2 domain-containing protein n=1 Tax=Abeliophyllum distichum TaxID=126358 RepID=A0ABD1TJM2_9LAMI